MLKEFRVDNFKSLINFSFSPIGMNLLVGPNNAGKTNLAHALRFLSLTSQMPLDDAAAACTADPWNLLNVYLPKRTTVVLAATAELLLDDERLVFEYELTIATGQGQRGLASRGRPFVVQRESLRVSGGRFSDTVLLENEGGRVKLLHEKRFLRAVPVETEPRYVETLAPTNATMLFRLFDLETNQRANLFKRYLGAWGYYSLEPARLRQNRARTLDVALDSDGSNLSSVLFTLHNANPRVEKAIIEAVKLLEPRLDLFSFQTPDPDHVYMFFEDKAGNRFGVDNVSDGTLRYLAMCCLVLTNRQRDGDIGAPPVIIIEEPENGIFVVHLKALFERIEPSGAQGQFVFTSHSPYFIDLFDGAIEGLFVIRPGETNSTLVKPDPTRLAERLGKFSLGELHFRGLLE